MRKVNGLFPGLQVILTGTVGQVSSTNGGVLWTCRPRAAVLGLDKPDLIEVRAPKPTQVLLTTEDNCFPYSGGVKVRNAIFVPFIYKNDHFAKTGSGQT